MINTIQGYWGHIKKGHLIYCGTEDGKRRRAWLPVQSQWLVQSHELKEWGAFWGIILLGLGFSGGSDGKKFACSEGVQLLGQEHPLEKGMSIMSDSLWPIDCSSPGSSVHGILQARILEWVAMPSWSSRPRIEPRSPALRADSLPSEPLGKPAWW